MTSNLAKRSKYRPFDMKILEGQLGMMLACLKSYGKQYSQQLGAGWALAIFGAEMTSDEFMAGVAEYLLDTAGEFPTPGQFVDRVRAIRQRNEIAETLERTRLAAIREDAERVANSVRLRGLPKPNREDVLALTQGSARNLRQMPGLEPAEYIDFAKEVDAREKAQRLKAREDLN